MNANRSKDQGGITRATALEAGAIGVGEIEKTTSGRWVFTFSARGRVAALPSRTKTIAKQRRAQRVGFRAWCIWVGINAEGPFDCCSFAHSVWWHLSDKVSGANPRKYLSAAVVKGDECVTRLHGGTHG